MLDNIMDFIVLSFILVPFGYIMWDQLSFWKELEDGESR